MRKYRSLCARLAVVAIVVASTAVGAAPPERTRLVQKDASVGGQLLDEFGNPVGYFSTSTTLSVTDGVEELSSYVSIGAGSCWGYANVDGEAWTTATTGKQGGSASSTISTMDPYGNQIDVTFSGSGTQAYNSRVSYLLENASGATRLRATIDDVPLSTSQLDISVNGVPCFSGPLSGGNLSVTEIRAVITAS